MSCNHDEVKLVGTADGIRCTECGKLFATYQDVLADRKKPEEPKPKPRKK